MDNYPTTQTPLIVQSSRSRGLDPMTGITILGVGVGAYYFVLKPFLEKKRKQDAENKLGTDIPTQQATRIRNAIQGIGTDLPGLQKVFSEITDFAKVAEAYHNLNGQTIEQDLRDERKVTPEEYADLFKLMNLKTAVNNGNYTTPNGGSPLKKGSLVISTSKANVRKSPSKLEGRFFDTIENYSLATVPSNTLIGIATGNTVVDAESKINFVEVLVFAKDDSNPNYSLRCYVAASQCKLLNGPDAVKWGKDNTTKDGKKLNSFASYRKKYDLLKGLYSNIQGLGTTMQGDSTMQIVTIQPTLIVAFKNEALTSQVPRGTILGFPYMEIEINDTKFTYFRSLKDIVWVVPSSSIKIEKIA